MSRHFERDVMVRVNPEVAKALKGRSAVVTPVMQGQTLLGAVYLQTVIEPEDLELFWYAETAEDIWNSIRAWTRARNAAFGPEEAK